MRRSTALIAAAALCGLAVPTAGAAPVAPGAEDELGLVSVDLDTNGRAIVAYERTRGGQRGVYASTRAVGRYLTRDAGVRLGTGSLVLARLADGGGPDVVVWRRAGVTRVTLRRGGPFRTEILPAAVRRTNVLAGAVAGRRVVLVVGGATTATVVVRGPAGTWRAVPLPGLAAGRSALLARVAEGSGRVVATWSQGPVGPLQAVLAATWSPATGTWSAPRTLVPSNSFGAPVPLRLVLNRRGAAVVTIGRNDAYADSFQPVPEPRLHVLDARATTWRAAPGVPAGVPAVAPDGTVLNVWREELAPGLNRVAVAELPVGSTTWSAPAEIARIADDDVQQLSGIDDVAVAEDGRVAVSAEINPGPGPDAHRWYTRASISAPWREIRGTASTYTGVELVSGRTRIAALWFADAAESGLPEGDLIPR